MYRSRFLAYPGLSVIIAVTTLTTAVQPSIAQNQVTIRVLAHDNELSKDDIAAFEKANPDIKIDFTDSAGLNLNLAIATGDLPDVIRVDPSQVSDLYYAGKALDITDYLKASKIITMNDLVNAADYFKFNNRYYGLPKDWSPDFSLYIDRSAFQSAGISIPSDKDPMTYVDLAQIAKKLAVIENGKVIRNGFFTADYLYSITAIMLQRGSTLFNKDYTEMQLTRNPVAMEVVRYFYDLGVDGTMNADLSTMAQFWSASLPSAIVQWGYWYGGSVPPDNQNYDNLIMLPAPTWDQSLPRIDATAGPTGLAISATTQHPNEAYRFFEWYVAGDGGKARAVHGWGVPVLKSMFSLLPRTTAFDNQRYGVLMGELAYSNWKFPVYPFKTIDDTFNASWQRNIAQAAQAKIDFNTFASNIEQEVNLAILSEQQSSQQKPTS